MLEALLVITEFDELEERLFKLDALLETVVLETAALLDATILDELLATTALLTDDAVLVGGGLVDFEPPPPPQPLSVRAKIRILLGIKRDGA